MTRRPVHQLDPKFGSRQVEYNKDDIVWRVDIYNLPVSLPTRNTLCLLHWHVVPFSHSGKTARHRNGSKSWVMVYEVHSLELSEYSCSSWSRFSVLTRTPLSPTFRYQVKPITYLYGRERPTNCLFWIIWSVTKKHTLQRTKQGKRVDVLHPYYG